MITIIIERFDGLSGRPGRLKKGVVLSFMVLSTSDLGDLSSSTDPSQVGRDGGSAPSVLLS